MIKSEKFKLNLIHKSLLFIPEKIAQPFLKTKDKRAKFKVISNKTTIEFHGALKLDKSSGDYKVMFSKEKQKTLGLVLGDEFSIQLFEDTSKYGVEMPEELEAVLQSDYNAFTIFESLTAGQKRSIIYAIKKIKNSQTRIDKSLIACDNLQRGIRNPMELLKSN